MLETGCAAGRLGGLLLCVAFLGSSRAVLHGRKQSPALAGPDDGAGDERFGKSANNGFLDAVRESIKALNVTRDVADLMLKAARERRSFEDVYTEAFDSGQVAIQEGDPKATDWSPVEQVPGEPSVVTGRSYVFVTHHKTGTNLMQQICNLTAMLVTDGRDQCAFCFRLRPPKAEGERPSCMPNPVVAHGPLRGTFSRFTLISAMNAWELHNLEDNAPDFRVLHMIRDPVKLALSDYSYNTFLASPEGHGMAWDQHAFFPGDNLTENLQIEAESTLEYSRDMAELDAAARGDPRVLSLDLEAFYSDYNGTARRLFSHMFDDPPTDQLSELLDEASKHDMGRWTQEKKTGIPAAHSSDTVNKTEVQECWEELVEARDPKVMVIMQYAEALGYGINGTRGNGTRRLPA